MKINKRSKKKNEKQGKICFKRKRKAKEIKKKKIITVNPFVVWPVFTLPTRGLKLYTLPT